MRQIRKENLCRIIAETESSLEMDFDGVAVGNRELAVSFARKFADFDEKQLNTIRRLLEEGTN